MTMTTIMIVRRISILGSRMLERSSAVVSCGCWVTANAAQTHLPSTHHSLLTTKLGRFPIRAVIACSLLVLSACNFAPKHVQPPLPTPVAYDASTDPAAGTRAVNIGWRDFFTDPRLEALIEAALVHNRDLAVAVARIEVARGFYRVQGAERYPAPRSRARTGSPRR